MNWRYIYIYFFLEGKYRYFISILFKYIYLYIERIYFLDKSKLLFYALENMVNEVAADEEIITTLLQGEPRSVPWNELQVYKA